MKHADNNFPTFIAFTVFEKAFDRFTGTNCRA